MSQNEKNEIPQLPEKYRPLSAWAYWGLTILYTIPLIGTICLIAHALSGSNVNRRAFARSYFCTIALVFIVIIALGGIGTVGATIQNLLDLLSSAQ